jgi:hypothetical protein
MYDCCNILYDQEMKVFESVIKDFSEEERTGLLQKLGQNEGIPPCRSQIEFCLTEWMNRLIQQPDNNLRVLSQECVMARNIDNMCYDFSSHLKTRNNIEATKLSEIIMMSGAVI